MRPVSSRHAKSSKARRTGRHRAPSRVPGTYKIIGATAPAVVLLGAFAAYQAAPQLPSPAPSGVAASNLQSLSPAGVVANGSGTALFTRSARGDTRKKAGKSGTADKAAARTRQPVKGQSAHRVGTAPSAPAPSPSASAAPSGSQASLKAAVQKDIANGNYLLAVAQFMVENGYSRAAAAGIASCTDGESGGNPESVGSGGGGLIGWTPISSAAPNPNIVTGNAAQDMATQLSDILYYNSVEIGQSLVVQLNGISDPVAAADFYSQNFEKPAVTNSDVVPSVAQQIFSELGG